MVRVRKRHTKGARRHAEDGNFRVLQIRGSFLVRDRIYTSLCGPRPVGRQKETTLMENSRDLRLAYRNPSKPCISRSPCASTLRPCPISPTASCCHPIAAQLGILEQQNPEALEVLREFVDSLLVKIEPRNDTPTTPSFTPGWGWSDRES
jgi:hypothetical protein